MAGLVGGREGVAASMGSPGAFLLLDGFGAYLSCAAC